jgi:predicted GIY-YIG superfamily endonuclease
MTCYVYLIQAGDTDYYKIGIASSPEVRLKEIQTGNPLKVSIIGVIGFPDRGSAIVVESMLHKKLSDYRASGEWFIIDSSIYEKIKWFFSDDLEIDMIPKIRTTRQRINSKINLAKRWLENNPADADQTGEWLQNNVMPYGEEISYRTWNRAKESIQKKRK